MTPLKRFSVLGICFVLITGTLSHFLYDWTNRNFLTGLFSPVNESVWEHMKLIFFPMLFYSLILFVKLKTEYPCIISSVCFGILTGTFLIPVLFYAYTCLLGQNVFLLDLATFVLSAAAAFFAVYKLTESCRLKSLAPLLLALTGTLFLCFLWFSYHPPDLFLFADPAALRT